MERSNERTLTELADAAFREAAKQVIDRAIQTGTPVIIREQGSMRKVEFFPEAGSRTRKESVESDGIQ